MESLGLIELDSRALAEHNDQENREHAEAILAAYELAERSADAVRQDAVTSIRHAVRVGDLLNQQRSRTGKGYWGEWCKTWIPQLHPKKVTYWMKLAKAAPEGRGLESAPSLNRAMIMVGVISDPSLRRRELKKQAVTNGHVRLTAKGYSRPDPDFQFALRSFLSRKEVEGFLHFKVYDSWGTNDLAVIREALRPLNLAFERVSRSLEKRGE
jgi:hypothetical protein